MATPLNWTRKSSFQSFLLVGLFFFFAGHILLLSPSSLEDDFTGMRVLHPRDLLGFLKSEPDSRLDTPLIHDVPPTYSLRDFLLHSSQGTTPELKLKARKTNFYQTEKTAHYRDLEATLKDGTLLTAREALHDLSTGKITFSGSVQTRFPAGAEVHSEQAILESRPTLKIEIPVTERVEGSDLKSAQPIHFASYGLEYSEAEKGILHLSSQVSVRTSSPRPLEIRSDRATFHQETGILLFTMDDSRIIERQFVTAQEPDFELRARTLELKLARRNRPEEVSAHRDVWFRDHHSDEKITEGTGGEGLFEASKNRITLTDFPQLYQDRDTVTGEAITYDRDADTVEVKQSNAVYNQSSQNSNR